MGKRHYTCGCIHYIKHYDGGGSGMGGGTDEWWKRCATHSAEIKKENDDERKRKQDIALNRNARMRSLRIPEEIAKRSKSKRSLLQKHKRDLTKAIENLEYIKAKKQKISHEPGLIRCYERYVKELKDLIRDENL